ncbi:MAG: sugar MFS transporter [Thiovulaceae bacterium]|nr:sugar MFS transporter [Sulfurimonadaceae bacterium]
MNIRSSFVPMGILGVLFFIFGFVTWLNGSLIPYLQIICALDAFEALLVSFAFYIAYTVMAFPMSLVLEKTGYKNGMVLGLLVMGCGSLLFIPAAQSASYPLFLGALFVLATGLTILQTASNPYVVLLGPIESAAMRISIMGLINKGAGVAAPLVFTALVFGDMGVSLEASQPQELAQKLIVPYLAMAGVLGVLALFVRFSPLEEIVFEEEDAMDKGSVFAFPHAVLGAVALFFYVGIEVIAGDTIGLYAQQLGTPYATSMTSFTMAFMVLGYLVGVAFIPRFLSQERALLLSALGGIMFTLAIVFSSQDSHAITQALWGHTSVPLLPDSLFFVALLGFANALVWPSIWPLALKGVGRYSAQVSALLITAIAGGALLPLVFGKLSLWLGNMQEAYAMGLACYAFILCYALWWHKKTSWGNR